MTIIQPVQKEMRKTFGRVWSYNNKLLKSRWQRILNKNSFNYDYPFSLLLSG